MEAGNETSTGTNSHWFALLVAGVGAGAALMYLFDPDRGRGRRARLSDQVMSKAHRLEERMGAKSRDLRNRARGLLHQTGIRAATKQEETSTLGSTGRRNAAL